MDTADGRPVVVTLSLPEKHLQAQLSVLPDLMIQEVGVGPANVHV